MAAPHNRLFLSTLSQRQRLKKIELNIAPPYLRATQSPGRAPTSAISISKIAMGLILGGAVGLLAYRSKPLSRNSISSTMIARNWQPGKAATAGLIATIVYSIVMENDKFLSGNRFSDVRFIDGMLEGEKRTRGNMTLAWIIHLLNGVLLAEIYAALIKRFLPGPRWLRGTLFGEIFVIGAWLLTPLADKYHPLIKNGEMPPLANWRSFWQNSLRHLAFGLTLGLLYRDK